METTKRTTATVRVMLSHAYCNFEVALTLENPDGVSNEEIEQARQDCQQSAARGVGEYKSNPILSSNEELKRIEAKLSELKKQIGREETAPDPEAVKAIESLPLYQSPGKTPTARKTSKLK